MATETDFPRPLSMRELEDIAYGTGSLDAKTKIKAARELRKRRKQLDEQIARAKARQSTDSANE